MSLTPQFQEAVRSAITEAVSTLNAGGEVFYYTPENEAIVRKFLLAEGLSQANWTSAFIWQSAMLECRKRGVLVSRPPQRTREQIEAERHAADGQAGRQKYFDDDRAPAKNFLQQIRENVEATQSANEADRVNKQTAEQAAAVKRQEILRALPLAAAYQNMPPENKKLYRSLTAENMKAFNKRQAEFAHKQKYPDAYDGR